MSAQKRDFNTGAQYEKVFIFFKKITSAPIIDRIMDYCSDVSYLCSNKSLQHVEIAFLEKGRYVTYLATTNYDGIITIERDYTFIDNEGYWVCYSIKIPKKEAKMIRKYCDDSMQSAKYDFSSLYLVCSEKLSFSFKRENTHSCASLCFSSLLQSPSFRNLLLYHCFNNNNEDMIKASHCADPNKIYAMIKILIDKSKNGDFNGFIICEKEKINYVYDFCELNNISNKMIIKSSDEYFISELSEEDP